MSPKEAERFRRRRRQVMALGCLWAAASPVAGAEDADPPTGWVRRLQAAPALRITLADGRLLPLAAAIAGRITAVQLMFTGCGTTCPIQGALFAALAGRQRPGDAQLLSISIDALGDTPDRLRAWQARFGEHHAWRAAVAAVGDVDRLADFMKGAAARPGTHTAQVFLFDRAARLRHRTGDSPGIGEVEDLLARLAAQPA